MDSRNSCKCHWCRDAGHSYYQSANRENIFLQQYESQNSDSKISFSQHSNSRQMEIESPMRISSLSPSHSFSNKSSVHSQELIREEGSGRRQEEMKTICPKCTQYVEISQIRQHMDQCAYIICRFCREYYPGEIALDHEMSCRTRQIQRNSLSIEEELSESHHSLRSMHFNEQNSLDSNFSTPSRSQPSLPDSPDSSSFRHAIQSEFQRNQTIPLVHPGRVGSNQMLPIDFRTRLDEPTSVSHLENQSRTLFLIRLNSLSREHDPFSRTFSQLENDNLYLRIDHNENDIIWQQIFTHENFMRHNRNLMTPDLLMNLLVHLFNPNRGIRSEELSRLEEVTFRRNSQVISGEEEKCPVCFTEFVNGETIRRLPCKHLFHVSCVDTWLVQNSHCPVCRKDISSVLRNTEDD